MTTTRQIARRLQKEYLQARSWRKVAENYQPISFATLAHIARSDGRYFPLKWHERLGVSLPCPLCHRRINGHAPRPRRAAWRSLMDVDLKRLVWMFENRETF